MNTTSYLPINRQALSLMILICIIMGAQQVVMKAAAPDMAPILQIALRSLVAGLILMGLVIIKKEHLQFQPQTLKAGCLVGFLFGFEYLLVGEGLRYTTASHMVVFLYTSPIFTALGLHIFIPAERLNRIQWGGIALAFIGIVVIFIKGNDDTSTTHPMMLWGDFLGLLGGLSWAATTLVIRTTRLAYSPVKQTLMYQLFGAFILLLPVSLFTGQSDIHWTPVLWFSMIYQTFIICLLSFLLWFWLLSRYLASMLGVLSFMTPVFGVIMGVLFLNEPLTLRFVIGSVLAMVGLIIVTGLDGIRIFYHKYKDKKQMK